MTTLNFLLLATEAALASLVLPVLACLIARLCPRSAARRRLVWTTMFAILLILPLAAMIAPSLAVITLAAPPMETAPAARAPVAAAPEHATEAVSPFAEALGVIVITWALGALLVSARGLGGLLSLRSLRRGSVRAPAERLPVSVPRSCSVRLSPDCAGPMTWGALRPVILLPDDAFDWPQGRLEAALRHELAHVRARDSLVQVLTLLVCALYWPNPLVHWAAGALRREAEAAADDAVIAAGVRPSDYAAQLLDIAREWHAPQPMPAGLAMAAPPILTERVQSILSTDAIRTGATSMDAFKLVLIGGAATGALALAHPSVAEVPAPAPAPVAQTELAPLPPPAPLAAPAAPAAPAVRREVVRHADRRSVELAQQNVPAPPAAAVPPAAPAAPQPAWIPAPAAGAALNLQWVANPDGGTLPLPPGPPGAVIIRGHLTPEQRAELERKTAAIGPAIEKAIAEAHIDEAVQKALSAQDAKTREEVARQLEQIGPRIQQAIAAAHIQELRLAQLQPSPEAIRKMREQQAQAEDRVAAQLEEQAKRARERAQRARDQLKDTPPAPAPKN